MSVYASGSKQALCKSVPSGSKVRILVLTRIIWRSSPMAEALVLGTSK
jgi:hypothetical protein